MKDQPLNSESVLPIVSEKNPPDLKGVFTEVKSSAEGAMASVDAELTTAINLGERAGKEAGPVIEQINTLKNKVSEGEAAFETKAERLNSPYVLSPEMAKVLKVSRVLEKPLLLEGEPGTGKTSLAYALAGNEDLPIIHAQCKSTTTAKDLLYTFDVVKRLQDALLGKDVSDLSQYVHLGPLGKAFASQEQVILLIDEIDKAKRDFSNDLLHELDQMSFFVEETGEEISAKHRPVVLITSNHERDLPEPVLRRVVYHYIDFPPSEQMTEIVRAHIPDVGDKLLESAMRRFYEIRDIDGLEKKPSTSEILDWIRVLEEFGVEKVGDETPYPETLLKHRKDYEKVVGTQGEKHKKVAIPEEAKEILAGNRVITLKAEQDWAARNKMYRVLANAGFSFNTYDENNMFDVHVEGVRRIDNSFKLSLTQGSEPANKLYKLLKKENLVESEFVVSDKPVEFEDVDESNKLYTKGRDAEGLTVYRTAKGKFVREVKIPVKSEEKSGGEDELSDENLLGEATQAKLRGE